MRVIFKQVSRFYIFLLLLILGSCTHPKTNSVEIKIDQSSNLLATMTATNMLGFKWMNIPDNYEFTGNSLKITAGENTDYFNDPVGCSMNTNAPLLYKEVEGDFVAKALVKPKFNSVWNGAALMIFMEDKYWAKFCFENSDATGPSPVSVVTREVSDDANGVILNGEKLLWLKLIRKGDLYAMHWSKDGENYKMARLFKMPHHKSVKVGIEAQCPVGKSAIHEFLYFSLEQKTVNDLRRGQ